MIPPADWATPFVAQGWTWCDDMGGAYPSIARIDRRGDFYSVMSDGSGSVLSAAATSPLYFTSLEGIVNACDILADRNGGWAIGSPVQGGRG